MKFFRTVPGLIVGASALLLLSLAARAETTFHDTKPSSEISLKDAGKMKGKSFVKCERVRQGPNLNPVKVPGSKASFHSNVGKTIANAADLIADGKSVYRCNDVEIDPETARVRKVSN